MKKGEAGWLPPFICQYNFLNPTKHFLRNVLEVNVQFPMVCATLAYLPNRARLFDNRRRKCAMTLAEAFDIIMDLAVDNAIEEKDADGALQDEYDRQQEAFKLAGQIRDHLT